MNIQKSLILGTSIAMNTMSFGTTPFIPEILSVHDANPNSSVMVSVTDLTDSTPSVQTATLHETNAAPCEIHPLPTAPTTFATKLTSGQTCWSRINTSDGESTPNPTSFVLSIHQLIGQPNWTCYLAYLNSGPGNSRFIVEGGRTDNDCSHIHCAVKTVSSSTSPIYTYKFTVTKTKNSSGFVNCQTSPASVIALKNNNLNEKYT